MKIQELVQRFENGTLKEEEFRHREHLLIALWYCAHCSEREAIVKIKFGILKYNLLFQVNQGDRGYHETITMFYFKRAQKFTKTAPAPTNMDDFGEQFVNEVGTSFKPSIQEYYSKERVMDPYAVLHWIEPDLKSI